MPTIQDEKKMQALRDWFNNPNLEIAKPSDNAPDVFSVDDVRIEGLHGVPLMVVFTEEQNAIEGSAAGKSYKRITQIHHRDGTPYIVYHNMPNR